MDVFLKRLLSIFIDSVIVYIPSFIIKKIIDILFLSEVILVNGDNSFIDKFILWAYEYIIFIIIFVVYTVFMEYKYKKTIGKRYTKLKLVYERKTTLKIVIRSFIKAISITSFYGFISVCSGLIMILINPEISVHDYIVRSKVCVK